MGKSMEEERDLVKLVSSGCRRRVHGTRGLERKARSSTGFRQHAQNSGLYTVPGGTHRCALKGGVVESDVFSKEIPPAEIG